MKKQIKKEIRWENKINIGKRKNERIEEIKFKFIID